MVKSILNSDRDENDLSRLFDDATSPFISCLSGQQKAYLKRNCKFRSYASGSTIVQRDEATTAVSFEVLIDHEPDEASPVQEVWLDSITMAVSSVGTDLAQTIADNRVFVEQNFEGGST